MARDRELPPPLEMLCLNALWSIGEGNVEEIRARIRYDRPLAYTTVLTLLDRLEQRKTVTRRREGRGFRYTAAVERNKLREIAVESFVQLYFDGDVNGLRAFLDSVPAPPEAPLASAATAS